MIGSLSPMQAYKVFDRSYTLIRALCKLGLISPDYSTREEVLLEWYSLYKRLRSWRGQSGCSTGTI